MDYGRYKYTQQKKGKEAKRRQKIIELKEVKMRIKIDEHDYEFKKNHAARFLKDGNKAKVTIMFRGREVTHPDLGRKLLERVANELIEICTIEQYPLLEGRNMTMVLAPIKSAVKAKGSSGGQGKSGTKPPQAGEAEPVKTFLAESLEKAGVAEGDSSGEGEEAESTGPEAESEAKFEAESETESGAESEEEQKEGTSDAEA
jgi:translation initiation factor IF-3